MSRRAPGTMRSETESSEQTRRDRRVMKRAAAGRRASTVSTANIVIKTNTHGTESQRGAVTSANGKLDVAFSHGARLLSRLTGSARKYAETIELDKVRCSTGENKDIREGMVAGVKYLLKPLDRAMGMEDAPKKGHVQEFFYKEPQRRPGQPVAERVNVFEKAVLDMKAKGLNVELKSMGWHLFGKSNLLLSNSNVCWDVLKAHSSSQPFEER